MQHMDMPCSITAACMPARAQCKITFVPWQAVFHLQTRVPAVLPPICALLELPEDAVLERPLHGGREASLGLLEVCWL